MRAAKTRWGGQRVSTQNLLLPVAATGTLAAASTTLTLGGITSFLLLGVAARSRSVLAWSVSRDDISF